MLRRECPGSTVKNTREPSYRYLKYGWAFAARAR